jgi:hypothetical protein
MSCQPEELAQPAAVDSVAVTRRLANDAIFEAAERFGGSDQHLYQFVCECGSRECHELVLVSLDEYRRREPGTIRAHP